MTLPSPEHAAALAPWLDRFGRREVRVLLHLVIHRGEHRAADLARAFECSGPNLHQSLAVLASAGLVTCRRVREPHSKKPVNHYRLKAESGAQSAERQAA